MHRRAQLQGHTAVGEVGDDVAGVGQGAGEAVELGDDQGVPAPARGEGFAQPRAGAVRPGEAVVDVDPLCFDAERGEGVALGGRVLLGGRDPRISNPYPTSTAHLRAGWSAHGVSLHDCSPIAPRHWAFSRAGRTKTFPERGGRQRRVITRCRAGGSSYGTTAYRPTISRPAASPDDMEGGLQRAVGRNLRAYRLERGLSQEAFVGVVGVHRTYMGGLERGEATLRCGRWSGLQR